MKILTLYMFHNSSCCLSINGEIVSALHEDRFVKRKNEVAKCSKYNVMQTKP